MNYLYLLLLPSLTAALAGGVLAQKNLGDLLEKSEELHGVIGELSDQSATALICRKNGTCLPGDGTNIETGDAIKAPNLVTLYIEDPDGFSMHGLTGEVASSKLYRAKNGELVVDMTLSKGKMEGTVRKVAHLIRMGIGFCLLRRSDYVAEVDDAGGLFKIEKGSAECHDGKRSVKIDPRNSVMRWANNGGASDDEPKENTHPPSSNTLDKLPAIKPF